MPYGRWNMKAEIRAVIEKYKDHIPVIAMAELLTVLDEEEYCEWKPHGVYGWIIVSDHAEAEARNRDDIKNRPHCTVCGRKIKVKEREADI